MTDRFLRREDVERLTGLARSTLYEFMANGTFPKSIKIGGRAVAWAESDIARWQEARKAKANSSAEVA